MTQTRKSPHPRTLWADTIETPVSDEMRAFLKVWIKAARELVTDAEAARVETQNAGDATTRINREAALATQDEIADILCNIPSRTIHDSFAKLALWRYRLDPRQSPNFARLSPHERVAVIAFHEICQFIRPAND